MFTCHVNIDHASKCIIKYKKVHKNLKIKAFLAKINKAKSGLMHLGKTNAIMLRTLVYISLTRKRLFCLFYSF